MRKDVEVYVDYSAINKLLVRRPYMRELNRLVRSIERLARAQASQYSTNNPTYAPSFTGLVAKRLDVPTGYVYGSRHEMVNEFGWTDLAGKHHPGRFVLRRSLRMHRIS